MQVIQYLHTAILVSNLEKAEHFYSHILGLSKVERPLNYAGVWYQVGNYQIHLIVEPNLTRKLDNQEKWGRNPHIALAVTSLAEAKEILQSQGYPFQISASGRSALFTQDPDGNIIEINEQKLN